MNKADVKNEGGFTLTEVLIGIMILTIAIVSATSMVTGLMNTNRKNVLNLEAYFLAQEGLEAVRNIRDTNWLHNMHLKGDLSGVYGVFQTGYSYGVFADEAGWANSEIISLHTKAQLDFYKPWIITPGIETAEMDPLDPSFALNLNPEGDYKYYSGNGNESGDAKFYRHIEIIDPCPVEEDTGGLPEQYSEGDSICEDSVIVRSVVHFKEDSRSGSLFLDAVLTDWKGGAL